MILPTYWIFKEIEKGNQSGVPLGQKLEVRLEPEKKGASQPVARGTHDGTRTVRVIGLEWPVPSGPELTIY